MSEVVVRKCRLGSAVPNKSDVLGIMEWSSIYQVLAYTGSALCDCWDTLMIAVWTLMEYIKGTGTAN